MTCVIFINEGFGSKYLVISLTLEINLKLVREVVNICFQLLAVDEIK